MDLYAQPVPGSFDGLIPPFFEGLRCCSDTYEQGCMWSIVIYSCRDRGHASSLSLIDETPSYSVTVERVVHLRDYLKNL